MITKKLTIMMNVYVDFRQLYREFFRFCFAFCSSRNTANA